MAGAGQVEMTRMLRHLLLVTVLCQVWSLTTLRPHGDYVFSMAVSYSNKKFLVNFPTDTFLDFYHCLCKMATESCTAMTVSDQVTNIQENLFDSLRVQPSRFYNRYMCQHVINDNTIRCSKLQESQTNCSITSNCYTYHFKGDTSEACQTEPMGIIWISSQLMKGSYVVDVVEIKQCQAGCVVLNPQAIVFSGSNTLTTTTTIKQLFTSTQRGTNKSTESSTISSPVHPSPSTNSSTHKVDDIYESHEDTKGIIIGLVVSLVIVSLVLAILAFILCRRRKTAFFSKFTRSDPATTSSVPTLTQLHYIDSTYANISRLPAAAMTKFGDNLSDLDDYFNDGSSDGTEYEFDFSAFYNNINLNPESSMTDRNETGTGVYENYSRDHTGNLESDGGKQLSSDLCSDDKPQEADDEIVYEDLECSQFEKELSISQDNEDRDKFHYFENRDNDQDNNICDDETQHSCIEDITEEMPSLVETDTLSARSYRPCNDKDQLGPAVGAYLKLSAVVPFLGDCYNLIAGPHENNKQTSLSESSRSPPRKSHNLVHDPTEVASLPRTQSQGINHVQVDPSDATALNGTPDVEKPRNLKDDITDELEDRQPLGTTQQYYELEHASEHAASSPHECGMLEV